MDTVYCARVDKKWYSLIKIQLCKFISAIYFDWKKVVPVLLAFVLSYLVIINLERMVVNDAKLNAKGVENLISEQFKVVKLELIEMRESISYNSNEKLNYKDGVLDNEEFIYVFKGGRYYAWPYNIERGLNDLQMYPFFHKAEITGSVVLTSKLCSKQGKNNFVMVMPFYKKNGDRHGVVGMTFSMDAFFAHLFDKRDTIAVNIIDVNAEQKEHGDGGHFYSSLKSDHKYKRLFKENLIIGGKVLQLEFFVDEKCFVVTNVAKNSLLMLSFVLFCFFSYSDKKKNRANNDMEVSKFVKHLLNKMKFSLDMITGYTNLLLFESKAKGVVSVENKLEMVLESNKYLSKIIKEDLRYLGANSAQVDSCQERISVINMLEYLNKLFTFKANSKGVKFFTSVKYPLPEMIFVNANKIQQVAINLCDNALKFTPRGGVVELNISYNLLNKIFHVVVLDSGKGISVKDRDEIFVPFFQAESSDVSGSGLGLGLSICKRICTQMGGKLSLSDNPCGRGCLFDASFKVKFPDDVGLISSVELETRSDKIEIIKGKSGRVLLVDGIRDDRHLIEWNLDRLGLTGVFCENIKEGISILNEDRHAIDLVMFRSIFDDHGYDDIEELKKAAKGKPIILLRSDYGVSCTEKTNIFNAVANPIEFDMFGAIVRSFYNPCSLREDVFVRNFFGCELTRDSKACSFVNHESK